MLLTAGVVLIIVGTLQQSAFALRCHLCTEGEPSDFCNATSNVMNCETSGPRAGCVVQITNTGTRLTSWKACLPKNDCEVTARVNSALCDQGVVQGVCTYCCQGDFCNYDRFGYSVTTPAPTTPTPTTTMTSLSTIAPPDCSTGDLTSCVTDFGRFVNNSVYDPRGELPGFCRAMPFVFLCVLDALEGCISRDASSVSATVQQVSSALYAECPRDCSPTSGVECTQTLIQKITETFVYGTTPCRTITIEYQHFQHCVAYCTGSCDARTRTRFASVSSYCYRQVTKVCEEESASTPGVLPPGDDSPCRASQALHVISQLNLEIVNLLSRGDDVEEFCGGQLQEVRESVNVHIAQCDDAIKTRVSKLFNLTADSILSLCAAASEPTCNVTRARECVVDLWRLIDEAEDITEVCKAIPRTRKCAASNTAACTEEEKESIQKNLEIFINRVGDRCGDVFEPETPCNETITLKEGGKDHELKFKLGRSPSDICIGRENCQVFVEFVVNEGESPRCPDEGVIEQIVFLNGCTTEITNSNWDETHSVNITAKIDRKKDGDQTRTVTIVLKTVVNGVVVEARSLCHYQVVVIDMDTPSFCSSVNDPHITTFDGHYYHNFYDGEFVLYRHNRLPYQVNMMYQKCQERAACNCGVAVKSGDTVFVAEKCRRHSVVCPDNSPYCNGEEMRTRIFTHGHVTPPHMRIFSRNAGNGFDVLLPHGTKVQIRTGHLIQAFINVWVYPSPVDWHNTNGLCGYYDLNKGNDLRLPNGRTYRGRGRGRGQHPRQHCTAWRVPARATLFLGAEKATHTPRHHCGCTSGEASGNQMCTNSALVDTCDIDTSTEVSPALFPTINLDEVVQTQVRHTRDVTYQERDSFLNSLDLDLDYEPAGEDLEFDGQWTEADATTFCEDVIKNDRDWARKCLTVPGMESDLVMQNCIDDVMITGTTDWVDAALEALKLQCLHTLEVNVDFRQTFQGRRLEQQIRDQLCPMDCSDHGQCQRGTCICNDGYTGADCHFRVDTRPGDLSLPEGGLCNSRASNCSVIVVFGKNFVASDKLMCHLQAVQVTESGMGPASNPVINVKATYFSTNQILCAAPTDGSYLVDVSNDGVTSSGDQKLHVAHDPHCYNCVIEDNVEGARCSRTTSGCVVDGQCYKNGQENPDNDCYVCNPDKSLESFGRKLAVSCYVMELIIAACILVALFLLILIICCCCWRKKRSQSRVDSNEPTEKSAMFRSGHNMEMQKSSELPAEHTVV